jgi:nucleoside-diphosphate-sugar epimerase
MILITGATGLVGSRLLFDLTSRGEKVRALKRKNSNLDAVRRVFSYYSDNPGELFYNIEWVEADILNIDSLLDAMQNVTHVYHSAAYVSFNPADRETLINNNIAGTRNVVNACLARAVKKLCYVSSVAALGPAGVSGMVDENCMWTEKNTSGYSYSKFHSEMEVWKGIEEGLNAVIVNPSIVFGPGFWDKGSSSMFINIYRGLKFYTHGVTGFVSVEDVSAAMIALMKSNKTGERYILSSENLSYHEVFDMIAFPLGVKKPGIEARPFLMFIGLHLENLRCMFGAQRILTKETIAASRKKSYFSNTKFSGEFNVSFQGIKPVISKMAGFFIRDVRDGWFDKKFRHWGNPEKS